MDEKRGSSIYYALSVPCILDFLKCADALLQEISRAQVNGNNVAP